MSESARLITINPTSIDDALVVEAGAALAEELVAIPTETVYGLGCNALDPDAIAGVFEAKGRPASDPLIVHVDGVAMADTLIEGGLPTVATRLAAAFWPGPLTMVLPKTEIVPDAITSGGPTVGVRCPAHPVARALITASGVPVAAPSANRFGRISPTTAAHVVEELGDRIDLIVDAGPANHGVESTVVTFEGDDAVILRHGALTAEALADHVAVREVEEADAEARAAAPGHDLRHYSREHRQSPRRRLPAMRRRATSSMSRSTTVRFPFPVDGASSPSATDPTSNSSPATSTPTSGVSTPPPMT